MIWTVSKYKAFKRCQRQWYFNTIYKSHAAKDQSRYNAYLLSKLQSLYSWRGSIVDDVISNEFIRHLHFNREIIDKQELLKKARFIFDNQLEVARNNKLFDTRIKPSDINFFAALYPFEYEEEVSDTDIHKMWGDIEKSIDNLYAFKDLFKTLSEATKLIPQRSLSFSYFDNTVRAIPDLIVFFSKRPPIIIDWKVHTFGTNDAWFQLGCYSLCLSRCSPHKDFPVNQKYAAEDIQLIEVQLLQNQQRKYQLDANDIESIDDQIAKSIDQISLVVGNRKNNELTMNDFSVTNYPENCQSCSFRILCWEDAQWQELKQMSFL